MNGLKFVTETTADLPWLFITHGRQDGSIPWQNNPPFYRALDERGQGYAVYWDDNGHSQVARDAPEDVAAWQQRFRRFRLDESFPAFSNTSSNRDPGNGDPKDGDIIGWINRGMDWQAIEDTAARYIITLLADFPGATYPVLTDVTLRRVQRFRPGPGAPPSAVPPRAADGRTGRTDHLEAGADSRGLPPDCADARVGRAPSPVVASAALVPGRAFTMMA